MAQKSGAKKPSHRQMLYVRSGDEEVWRQAKALARRCRVSLSTLVTAKLEQVVAQGHKAER